MRNEELLLLIGKLNYAWTNTESLLIYLMSFIMGTTKEVSIVTFLTLNTSRARLDLIERLLRLESADDAVRVQLSPLVTRMKSASRIRNNYNHCIYSFDEHGEIEATQLMRIADYGDSLKYGKIQAIDGAEMERIKISIKEIVDINRSIFNFIKERDIEY